MDGDMVNYANPKQLLAVSCSGTNLIACCHIVQLSLSTDCIGKTYHINPDDTTDKLNICQTMPLAATELPAIQTAT